jgi:hypothetical protein
VNEELTSIEEKLISLAEMTGEAHNLVEGLFIRKD